MTRVTDAPTVAETESLLRIGPAYKRNIIAADTIWNAKQDDKLLTPTEVRALPPGTIIVYRVPGEEPRLAEVMAHVSGSTYLSDEWLYSKPIPPVGDGGPYTQVAVYRPAKSASIPSTESRSAPDFADRMSHDPTDKPPF